MHTLLLSEREQRTNQMSESLFYTWMSGEWLSMQISENVFGAPKSDP